MSQRQKRTTREPAAKSRWLSALAAGAQGALAGPQVAALKVVAQSASFRRGLRYFYFAALILLIGTLGLLAAGTAPTLFGYHNYVINGGSMEPSLQVGSIAVTGPTNPFALEVGDIIARNDGADGSPVLHRVVEITNVDGQLAFITQGDQNRTPDATPVVLVGTGDRVIYSVPYAGYILNFARSWLGRMILIGGPLAVLAITSANQARGWLRRRAEAEIGTAAEPAPLQQPASPEATAGEMPAEVGEAPAEVGEEPVAIEAALTETPPESENESVAIEAALTETPSESEDEPAPADATPPQTPPESEDELAAIEAALLETPPDMPDSPFPIEAVLEAQAKETPDEVLPQDINLNETPGQRGKRPTLREVPLPETPDDVPVFLLDQLRRRRVTSPAARPEEPGERRVA